MLSVTDLAVLSLNAVHFLLSGETVLCFVTNYISLTKVIDSEAIVKWSYYLNCIFKQDNLC